MSEPAPKPAPERLTSLDAYRGFVMFLMVAEAFRWASLGNAFPENSFWKLVAFNTSHVEWTGCSLHDLIQPSFSFMVGVALPYSIASRMAKGQSKMLMTAHACWRALILIFLGVFLRSVGKPETNFTFEDTLSQIGLGYPFLFVLGLRSPKAQWTALGIILFGYWLAFALYPLPGPDFDFTKVGVPADWPNHTTGFAAHWDKNANLGFDFNRWFLNLFPRSKPFEYNSGGYLTLSFIPTLGTMILGLIAGGWLRSPLAQNEKIKRFLIAGLAGLLIGGLLGWLGICPVVKRIWTPSWTLYSGGWCFLLLTAFYFLIDVRGWKGWSFPLVVIGMNSIAIYCMAHLIESFIVSSWKTHFGPNVFKVFGDTYVPLMQGTAVVSVLWLILYWMYRRKIFLRI